MCVRACSLWHLPRTFAVFGLFCTSSAPGPPSDDNIKMCSSVGASSPSVHATCPPHATPTSTELVVARGHPRKFLTIFFLKNQFLTIHRPSTHAQESEAYRQGKRYLTAGSSRETSQLEIKYSKAFVNVLSVADAVRMQGRTARSTRRQLSCPLAKCSVLAPPAR